MSLLDRANVPPRWIIYCSVFAIIFGTIAVLYRKFAGDSGIASAAGMFAVVLGFFVVAFFSVNRQRRYQGILNEDDFGSLPSSAKKFRLIGVITVVGSIAIFAILIAIFGASPENDFIFYIWLAIFLIGFVMLVSSSIIKLGIVLGLLPPKKKD